MPLISHDQRSSIWRIFTSTIHLSSLSSIAMDLPGTNQSPASRIEGWSSSFCFWRKWWIDRPRQPVMGDVDWLITWFLQYHGGSWGIKTSALAVAQPSTIWHLKLSMSRERWHWDVKTELTLSKEITRETERERERDEAEKRCQERGKLSRPTSTNL